MANLRALLMLRECKGGKPSLTVYRDSVGVLTVGIGHKVVSVDRLKLDDTVDDARVDAFFARDTAKAVTAARKQAALAGIKNAQFLTYLGSVNFQLGTRWYLKHRKTWQLIMDRKYEAAADELQRSRWAKQTPVRVKDFRRALLALKGGADDDGDSKTPAAGAGRGR